VVSDTPAIRCRPVRTSEHRAHPCQDELRYQTSSCPVFAGSAQNPVYVIRELRCIQRLCPAEVEALTARCEGGAAL
jgi:hypothetical protein